MTTDSPRWFKSSHSNNGGNCVEWAPAVAVSGIVPLRDSKRPTGPLLNIPASAFADLISAVKGGVFTA
ncbi:DUF397 domain-containing protein [Streptomyces mobaraensis NBRC 13819 = DSM 40847]|uniref:Uncharacterized protein n=1 Tax=Streptomyces mobaraensis (strain ATCC 29032 / DSM 40847 / JCM 4168 / NBRC 13819 / NCIMB 11159 / IPCR 16-22) TaxID=1223523 RepID=M3AA83_STRM1|nr:DUF397 domain-containing protein [Streptomyces mobaraensis]EMF02089.1 hypothetical protein H340_02629 [Streptomyces mobaraensis NBRC 13819 = DSM 40847]QTT76719.1 DUF397 domain-containing protein [Streptomyces mobaraensis NBRC 13819 = DSM 40847]